MTNIPFYADSVRWGNKYGNAALVDGLVRDGLTDVYDGKAMGFAARVMRKGLWYYAGAAGCICYRKL